MPGAVMPVIVDSGIRLRPNRGRVIPKPFLAHTGGIIDQVDRLRQVAERVSRLPAGEVETTLKELRGRFQHRHRDIDGVWLENYALMVDLVSELASVDDSDMRLLLGATFTQEYAIEGAALTNPSAVPTGEGEFVLSLRAIGEGHISSVEFRRGHVDHQGRVTISDPSRFARAGRRKDMTHQRQRFASKLAEMDAVDEVVDMVLDQLPEEFTEEDLVDAISIVSAKDRVRPFQAETTFHLFHWLASSNYELVFEDEELSERVLFPAGPADSNGMEDARFVRFIDESGEVRYYATYTAFDGFRILPQLIATDDFQRFTISTLHGTCAQNKGMALFPRQVSGQYVALGRHDQTNLHLLWTDDIWQWNNAEKLAEPAALWESVQIGNCGSPIETPSGWLVITHGVGPQRTYCLGAMLLDLDEPTKVIGRLPEPLLRPSEEERDGYVPNVVYSCGSFLSGSTVVLPYGIADQQVGIGTIDVEELIAAMIL